jgi:hypothetical protein
MLVRLSKDEPTRDGVLLISKRKTVTSAARLWLKKCFGSIPAKFKIRSLFV